MEDTGPTAHADHGGTRLDVPDPESAGPYVHGKLTSERLATRLAVELGLKLRVIRPGAIVDWHAFDPPGRLGRRIGNLFVAVGPAREEMGVVDLAFAAATVACMALEDDAAPAVLKLIVPAPPTRRALVERLQHDNPTVRVALGTTSHYRARAECGRALEPADPLRRCAPGGGRDFRAPGVGRRSDRGTAGSDTAPACEPEPEDASAAREFGPIDRNAKALDLACRGSLLENHRCHNLVRAWP